ncbi:MAG: PAS domain S-box protein, partial [Bacteroidetes bacterium]|nr:PAS domain S-box protein [Bacteroidota bacterium]
MTKKPTYEELEKRIQELEQAESESKQVEEQLHIYQAELETQNEELRQAQLALEAQRKKYSNLYDFAPIGYFSINQDLLIIETNLACSNLIGVERRNLIGRGFSHYIDKDSENEYYAFIRKGFETKEKHTCELKLLKKDGTSFYAQMECILAKDLQGDSNKLGISISDINKRKQAEKALDNSRKFLDSIIEQSPYPTWISDMDGTMIRANPALKKVLNLTDEQLIGKYNVFQDPQVEEQGILPVVRNALEKGETTDFTLTWSGEDTNDPNLKESNTVHCEGIVFPIYNQKGAITHA